MALKPNEARIRTVCLCLLSAVAIGFSLFWLRPVLVPFVVALFLSIALAPVVDFQVHKLRLPGLLVLFGTAVVSLVSFVAAWIVISAAVGQMIASLGTYEDRLEELIIQVEESPIWEKLQFDAFESDGGEGEGEGEAAGRPPEKPSNPVIVIEQLRSIDWTKTGVGDFLAGTMNAVMGLLSQGVLVLIFLLFMLLGRVSHAPEPGGVTAEIESRIRRYIVTKIVVSAMTGALTWIALELLGVQPAMVFGLFAFLLNFVPSIGSVIACVLPLPVVLVDPDFGVATTVLTVLIPGAIQFGIGNLLEPKMMGSSMDLHPITILLALIFWGMLWGIVGMLLATPITAALKILLERVQFMVPVAEALAGRMAPPRPATPDG